MAQAFGQKSLAIPHPPNITGFSSLARGSITLKTASSKLGSRTGSVIEMRDEITIKKRRLTSEVERQLVLLKDGLGIARGMTLNTEENPHSDAKVEEIAKALDAVNIIIPTLEKSIKECLEFCGTATKRPAQNQNPINQTAPTSTGKAKDDGPQGKLVASVYMLLESLTYSARAERGSVLLNNGKKSDELQAIAVVGNAGVRSNSTRVPVSVGTAGGVYASGIAVNQAVSTAEKTEERIQQLRNTSKFKTHCMLCFPIPSLNGPETVGVVQLLNKNRGLDSFTNDDEHLCYAATRLLSYLLKRYPVDWQNQQFNPSNIHSVIPWEVPVSQSAKQVPSTVSKHEARRLIFRTNVSGQYVRQKLLMGDSDCTQPLGPCVTLKEVDSYIQNLEECWRRSVTLNIDYEREQDGKLFQMRTMREATKRDKELITSLQNTINMDTAEMDGHQDRLKDIQSELKQLSQMRKQMKGPEFPYAI